MRWERLFDDLEAQLDASDAQELAGEIADRTRREVAAVTQLERLRAAIGRTIDVRVVGVGELTGRLHRTGPGWLLLGGVGQPELIVNAAAVISTRGLPVAACTTVGAVDLRLDLRYVLRAVARDRSPVLVRDTDGSSYAGTIDRVGADFLDLAEHAVGDARRASAVTGSRTLSLDGIAVVRAGTSG